MPLGQLEFYPQTCWESTLGLDGYAILRPTNTSFPVPSYIALALLPSVSSLGSFGTYEAAYNACQTNFNGLAT